MGLVQAWRAQGRTVLVVLHDLELVWRHFPQTLLLAPKATADVLTPKHLQRSRSMVEAFDETASACESARA